MSKKIARQRQDTGRKWAKLLVRDLDHLAVEDFKPKFLSKTTMARKAAEAAIGATKTVLIEAASTTDIASALRHSARDARRPLALLGLTVRPAQRVASVIAVRPAGRCVPMARLRPDEVQDFNSPPVPATSTPANKRYRCMRLKRITGSHGENLHERCEVDPLITRGSVVPALSTTHPPAQAGAPHGLSGPSARRHIGTAGVPCPAPRTGLGVIVSPARARWVRSGCA